MGQVVIKGIGAAMVGWTEHRVCNGTGRSGIQGVGAAMAVGTEHRGILWYR